MIFFIAGFSTTTLHILYSNPIINSRIKSLITMEDDPIQTEQKGSDEELGEPIDEENRFTSSSEEESTDSEAAKEVADGFIVDEEEEEEEEVVVKEKRKKKKK